MSNVLAKGRRDALPIMLSLALIAGYPFLGLLPANAMTDPSRAIGLFLDETAAWLYAGLVMFIVVIWQRRPLHEIGLAPPRDNTLTVGVWGAATAVAVGALVGSLVQTLTGRSADAGTQAAALTHGSVLYAVVLAIRAGTIEELLYRGTAIEQLSLLIGNRWLAAAIIGVLFVLAHGLVFHWPQLIPIAAATLVMTLLYLWRHNLWANILAHVLVDTVGLVVVTLRSHGGA
jgi:membrane protease YdiL (CAAX protease family)